MSTISVDTITDEAGTGAPNFPNGVTGVSSFKPVAVTGTTPSLDVGTYNFFDSGTLTADTTVSFASVPTTARWSYSFLPNHIPAAWDIAKPILKSRFFVEDTNIQPNDYQGVAGLRSLFFKPDGLKLYLVTTTRDSILEFDLSTAWDVTTTSYLQSFSTSTQATTPCGLFFKPDGLKVYVVGPSSDSVHEYDLSTAWDISTAVFLQSFSVSTQETGPVGMFFKPDGLTVYIVGSSGDGVDQYTLSTAWDISTMTFIRYYSMEEDSEPGTVFFKSDGLTMFIFGRNGNDLHRYTLSTAWDISTTTYEEQVNFSGTDGAIGGVWFKPDGETMYMAGDDFRKAGSFLMRESVYQFELGTIIDLTLPAAVEGDYNGPNELGTRMTYEFTTVDGGTTVAKTGSSQTELIFRNLDENRIVVNR